MVHYGDTGLRTPCTPTLKFAGLSVRRYDALPVSALVDLLTLKLVLIIAREMGNLFANLDVSRTFLFRRIGQHLSDASRDLAPLTFELGGHGACLSYGSSYSTSVPSFKFVSLSVLMT